MRFRFKVGDRYTRGDVYRELGMPPSTKGGKWDTGYYEHEGVWFVFCHVGTAGRTGHDYGNHWKGNDLIWRGRTGARKDHASIRALTGPSAEVYVFTRRGDREPFVFAGRARPVKVWDEIPVRIRWRFPWGDAARAAKNMPKRASPSGGIPE
jgi:5-methylcytosine-specific restriction enzyme A